MRKQYQLIEITVDGDKVDSSVIWQSKVMTDAENERVKLHEWVKINDGLYACSKCGKKPYFSGSILKYRFCPFCGDEKGDE